jgi:single-strand DNA-binding protein
VPSLNRVMLIGNLGADPETRYTANGNAITSFRLAVSEKFGEGKESTEWFTVVTWNQLAEICAGNLEKGKSVYVDGRLQTRSWDDKEGKKQYRTEVVAQRVQFLDKRGASPSAGDDIDAEDLPFGD